MTDNWKEILTAVLVKLDLLDNDTQKIEINCNASAVCDVKKTIRVK